MRSVLGSPYVGKPIRGYSRDLSPFPLNTGKDFVYLPIDFKRQVCVSHGTQGLRFAAQCVHEIMRSGKENGNYCIAALVGIQGAGSRDYLEVHCKYTPPN